MISPADYKIVADYIGLAESQKVEILYNFYLAYTELYTVPTTAMTNYPKTYGDQIFKKYTDYTPTDGFTKTMVSALQNHIFNNYGDVNTFLSGNALKVLADFAKLSAEVGYTINPGNIT